MEQSLRFCWILSALPSAYPGTMAHMANGVYRKRRSLMQADVEPEVLGALPVAAECRSVYSGGRSSWRVCVPRFEAPVLCLSRLIRAVRPAIVL